MSTESKLAGLMFANSGLNRNSRTFFGPRDVGQGPRDVGHFEKVREMLVKGPRDIGKGPRDVGKSPRDVGHFTNISRTLTNISRTFTNISRTFTNISRTLATNISRTYQVQSGRSQDNGRSAQKSTVPNEKKCQPKDTKINSKLIRSKLDSPCKFLLYVHRYG